MRVGKTENLRRKARENRKERKMEEKERTKKYQIIFLQKLWGRKKKRGGRDKGRAQKGKDARCVWAFFLRQFPRVIVISGRSIARHIVGIVS